MSPLLLELIQWLLRPRTVVGAVLVGALVISSLGVGYTSHQTRNMYRDLQALEKNFDDLEHEYEKLLLEESAWADYTRLDQLAQTELQMNAPTPEETVVLK